MAPINSAMATCKFSSLSVSSYITFNSSSSTSSAFLNDSFSDFLLSESNNNLNMDSENFRISGYVMNLPVSSIHSFIDLTCSMMTEADSSY